MHQVAESHLQNAVVAMFDDIIAAYDPTSSNPEHDRALGDLFGVVAASREDMTRAQSALVAIDAYLRRFW